MLSSHQQGFFAEKGYLVVEDVFDQTQILDPSGQNIAFCLTGLSKAG